MKQNRKATPPKKSHVHAAAGTRAVAASMALRIARDGSDTNASSVVEAKPG